MGTSSGRPPLSSLLSIALQKCIDESHGSAASAHFSKLSALRQDVDEIASSVHELSHGLHCSVLRVGLRAALQGLCRTASEQHHWKCHMGSGACWPSTSRNPVGEVICVRDFKRKLRGSQRGAAAISAVASAVRWAEEIIKGD